MWCKCKWAGLIDLLCLWRVNLQHVKPNHTQWPFRGFLMSLPASENWLQPQLRLLKITRNINEAFLCVIRIVQSDLCIMKQIFRALFPSSRFITSIHVSIFQPFYFPAWRILCVCFRCCNISWSIKSRLIRGVFVCLSNLEDEQDEEEQQDDLNADDEQLREEVSQHRLQRAHTW